MEDRVLEIIPDEQIKEKQILKNEDILRELWDNIMYINTHIIGVQKREGRGKGIKYIWRNISWRYP